jgi:hypothetical protein
LIGRKLWQFQGGTIDTKRDDKTAKVPIGHKSTTNLSIIPNILLSAARPNGASGFQPSHAIRPSTSGISWHVLKIKKNVSDPRKTVRVVTADGSAFPPTANETFHAIVLLENNVRLKTVRDRGAQSEFPDKDSLGRADEATRPTPAITGTIEEKWKAADCAAAGHLGSPEICVEIHQKFCHVVNARLLVVGSVSLGMQATNVSDIWLLIF